MKKETTIETIRLLDFVDEIEEARDQLQELEDIQLLTAYGIGELSGEDTYYRAVLCVSRVTGRIKERVAAISKEIQDCVEVSEVQE